MEGAAAVSAQHPDYRASTSFPQTRRANACTKGWLQAESREDVTQNMKDDLFLVPAFNWQPISQPIWFDICHPCEGRGLVGVDRLQAFRANELCEL